MSKSYFSLNKKSQKIIFQLILKLLLNIIKYNSFLKKSFLESDLFSRFFFFFGWKNCHKYPWYIIFPTSLISLLYVFFRNKQKKNQNIPLYFQSSLKITPTKQGDKTHAKTKPNLAMPWVTTAQSNLYFLQPKRIWAKILESTQFHFPFI